jgi:hypothetical protein
MFKQANEVIQVRCSCGQKIQLPTVAAGRTARCLNCRKVFRVPSPTPCAPGQTHGSVAHSQRITGPTLQPPAQYISKHRLARSQGGRKRTGVLIAIASMLVVALIIITVTLMHHQSILKADEQAWALLDRVSPIDRLATLAQYVETYPNGRHAIEAREEIPAEEVRHKEELAWSQLWGTEEQTEAHRLRQFLGNYPTGARASQARQYLDRYRVVIELLRRRVAQGPPNTLTQLENDMGRVGDIINGLRKLRVEITTLDHDPFILEASDVDSYAILNENKMIMEVSLLKNERVLFQPTTRRAREVRKHFDEIRRFGGSLKTETAVVSIAGIAFKYEDTERFIGSIAGPKKGPFEYAPKLGDTFSRGPIHLIRMGKRFLVLETLLLVQEIPDKRGSFVYCVFPPALTTVDVLDSWLKHNPVSIGL